MARVFSAAKISANRDNSRIVRRALAVISHKRWGSMLIGKVGRNREGFQKVQSCGNESNHRSGTRNYSGSRKPRRQASKFHCGEIVEEQSETSTWLQRVGYVLARKDAGRGYGFSAGSLQTAEAC